MLTIGMYGIPDAPPSAAPTHTHDHSLAFMRDGRVLDVVPLERVTRRKHDNHLPQHIATLLAAYRDAGPTRFVSVNSFAGDRFISAEGDLRIEPRAPVTIAPDAVPAHVRWSVGRATHETEGWVLCHEFAHLGSLLPFVERFEPASLLVHVDGGASASACTAWWWDGREARLLEASWDLLKEPLNNFNVGPLARLALGMSPSDHLAMPGKLMGLAGHGRPDAALRHWLADRSFFLGRDDDEARAALDGYFGSIIPWADLAATVQLDFERRVSAQILAWQDRTGARTLYYAGGAALNIPTNAALEASGRFDAIHIPPCTNDTGLALGAAAWLEYRERGHIERHDAFLATSDTGEPTLAEIDEIVARLAAGDVLGLCHGRAEVGPRALGHRSIVARPDDIALRQRVSEHIKRREPYRPVAPVLLAEVALAVFGPAVAHSRLAPYMLGAWKLLPGWEPHFRGVIHADGTLRAQVASEGDAFLTALLRRLWRDHGVAGLINTSFNGPGEPLVHTRADALGCARRLGLDGVVIEGRLLPA
ncbi:MAG: hypothetical protein JNK64_07855 [Myxococcales bacterium]|nr:hypothetical protein [Myxococcales bacterium]